MPLTISAADPAAKSCNLSVWTVSEPKAFINTLAALYLRRPTHAGKIMRRLGSGPLTFGGFEIDNAIHLLTVEKNDLAVQLASVDTAVSTAAAKTLETRIWHRDGLLFQHISWIAGALQFPNAKAKAPHVRTADKGFDGLFIEAAGGVFTRLVLCEDKATANPRSTMTGKVWPELLDTEAGKKDLELVDAVTALLDALMSEADRVAVVDGAIWAELRQYRVAITTAPSDIRPAGYEYIFKGFDDKASRPTTVRMGEVMPLQDIRGDLQALADRVIARLREIAAGV